MSIADSRDALQRAALAFAADRGDSVLLECAALSLSASDGDNHQRQLVAALKKPLIGEYARAHPTADRHLLMRLFGAAQKTVYAALEEAGIKIRLPLSYVPLRERFEMQYTPEPNTGCWLWTGAADQTGYGLCRGDGRGDRAHRAAWALYRGPIPDGLFVCHRCDTPPCVNPDHLFLGTADDNNKDRARKGRGAKCWSEKRWAAERRRRHVDR